MQIEKVPNKSWIQYLGSFYFIPDTLPFLGGIAGYENKTGTRYMFLRTDDVEPIDINCFFRFPPEIWIKIWNESEERYYQDRDEALKKDVDEYIGKIAKNIPDLGDVFK